MADNMVKNITSIEEDQKVKDYTIRLRDLRKDGVTKISDCRLEIVALKKNKLMDEGEKERRIRELQAEVEAAKKVEEKKEEAKVEDKSGEAKGDDVPDNTVEFKAPEKKDYMAMEYVPDIFVTGHVHGVGEEIYNGVRMINASTWQSQTEYQRQHNFNPDPGIMPVVDLGNGQIRMHNFHE